MVDTHLCPIFLTASALKSSSGNTLPRGLQSTVSPQAPQTKSQANCSRYCQSAATAVHQWKYHHIRAAEVNRHPSIPSAAPLHPCPSWVLPAWSCWSSIPGGSDRAQMPAWLWPRHDENHGFPTCEHTLPCHIKSKDEQVPQGGEARERGSQQRLPVGRAGGMSSTSAYIACHWVKNRIVPCGTRCLSRSCCAQAISQAGVQNRVFRQPKCRLAMLISIWGSLLPAGSLQLQAIFHRNICGLQIGLRLSGEHWSPALYLITLCGFTAWGRLVASHIDVEDPEKLRDTAFKWKQSFPHF